MGEDDCWLKVGDVLFLEILSTGAIIGKLDSSNPS
jgi:hypothetical protein